MPNAYKNDEYSQVWYFSRSVSLQTLHVRKNRAYLWRLARRFTHVSNWNWAATSLRPCNFDRSSVLVNICSSRYTTQGVDQCPVDSKLSDCRGHRVMSYFSFLVSASWLMIASSPSLLDKRLHWPSRRGFTSCCMSTYCINGWELIRTLAGVSVSSLVVFELSLVLCCDILATRLYSR